MFLVSTSTFHSLTSLAKADAALHHVLHCWQTLLVFPAPHANVFWFLETGPLLLDSLTTTWLLDGLPPLLLCTVHPGPVHPGPVHPGPPP